MNLRERVARHRAQMRAKGVRRIEVWVPDATRPGFADEVRCQADIINESDQREDIMKGIESVAVDWDDER